MPIIVEMSGCRDLEREYVLDIIFGEFLGLKWHDVQTERNDVRISLAGCEGEICLPDVLFQTASDNWLTSDSLPVQPLSMWDSSELALKIPLSDPAIPVIYGDRCSAILRDAHSVYLPIDIFGSAFFMLTRYEEIVKQDRDEHDRFPAWASLAYQEGFLDRPIIDEYVEILWSAMKKMWPSIARKKREFKMAVSHDVDSPSRYGFLSLPQAFRAMGGDLLRHGRIGTAVRGPWMRIGTRNHIHPCDPDNTFDLIMDISERNGLQSAFYFICGRTHKGYDAQYEIGHPAIRHLLRHIHERGHEIGLHPSYHAYQTPQVIMEEANRLHGVCDEEEILQDEWGGRMHYLRWKTPVTLYGWEQAGMTYDSTLCFADRAGFRCGTCHQYPAFDPVNREAMKLQIRPLIAMECSVIEKKYMGLGLTPAAYDEFVKLKNACRNVNGVFTLLWHNSQFRTKKSCVMYEAILQA